MDTGLCVCAWVAVDVWGVDAVRAVAMAPGALTMTSDRALSPAAIQVTHLPNMAVLPVNPECCRIYGAQDRAICHARRSWAISRAYRIFPTLVTTVTRAPHGDANLL